MVRTYNRKQRQTLVGILCFFLIAGVLYGGYWIIKQMGSPKEVEVQISMNTNGATIDNPTVTLEDKALTLTWSDNDYRFSNTFTAFKGNKIVITLPTAPEGYKWTASRDGKGNDKNIDAKDISVTNNIVNYTIEKGFFDLFINITLSEI